MSIVISVRVPRKLKEDAEKLGLNISEVLRGALAEEVKSKEVGVETMSTQKYIKLLK